MILILFQRKEYKKLNYVFCNKDIDNDIKEIYSYLDKDNYFSKILILENIDLSIKHQEKCLDDIASCIDKEIKKKFTKIDASLELKIKEIKIEKNFKIACEKLIKEWFANHKAERVKFDFVNNNIPGISDKIIYEGKYRKYLDEFFIFGSINKIKSLTNDIHHNKNNINNTNINNSINNYRIENYNNYNYGRNYNNNYSYDYYDNKSYDSPIKEIKLLNSPQDISPISENLKQYYLAQAYVYEDLKNSNLFEKIDWKNKANNIEEGEKISLLNKNEYIIKKSEYPFDIIVTNNNKTTNIIVQVLNIKRYNFVKLKCNANQWKLFINEEKEQNMTVLALVKIYWNNNPEIYYIKKSNLNEII